MKTSSLVKACGSIVKDESLIPVVYNILDNTCVAEANEPYSNYYGNVPQPAVPNSLFLFTSQYYSLEEVLRFTRNIDTCYMEKVNVAAASLDFGQHTYSAIRVKYFPDYEHLHLLQSCCIKEGIEFIKKVQLSDAAMGAIIIDSKAHDMVRVYSENLDLSLLKCVKEKFTKSILKT